MIVFWVPKEGLQGISGCPAFGAPTLFLELFHPYDIPYKTKIIFEDTPDKKDNNIFMVPGNGTVWNSGVFREYSMYERDIPGGAFRVRKEINWCEMNDIKIICDRSRERLVYHIDEITDFLKNNISKFKILMDCSSIDEHKIKKSNRKYLVDSKFFLYEMWFFKNKHEQKCNYKKKDLEKDYFFSAMFGDIRKDFRWALYKELEDRKLLQRVPNNHDTLCQF